MSIDVQRERERREARCAFCHDVVPTPELVSCGDCRTLLHDDCWQELGRCPTPGCSGRGTPVEGERCVSCLRPFHEGEGPLACTDCQLTVEDLVEHFPELDWVAPEWLPPAWFRRRPFQLLLFAAVLSAQILFCLLGAMLTG